MTTNLTVEEISIQLAKAQNKDINIKVEPTIGTTVHFLDVTIANSNGQLITTIYHKPTAEPYFLPYMSDHPRHIHRNIPYSALLRAARMCSNVYDFNQERLRIEISLLLNNYPPRFITNQFLRFFQVHRAETVLKHLDERTYQRLHHELLHQLSKREIDSNAVRRNPVLYPPVLHEKRSDPTLMYPWYTFQKWTCVEISSRIFSLVENALSASWITCQQNQDSLNDT